MTGGSLSATLYVDINNLRFQDLVDLDKAFNLELGTGKIRNGSVPKIYFFSN